MKLKTDYFVNAVVYGRFNSIPPEEELRASCNRGVDELVKTMNYRWESGENLDSVLCREFVREVRELQGLTSKSSLKKAMESVVYEYRAKNLALLFSGKMLGLDWEEISSYFSPVDDLELLRAAYSMDSDTLLSSLSYEWRTAVKSGLEAYSEVGDLGLLEAAIYRSAMEMKYDLFAKSSGRGCKEYFEVVKADIDLRNVTILLKGSELGAHRKTIMTNIIRRGTLYPDVVEKCSSLRSAEAVLGVVREKLKFGEVSSQKIEELSIEMESRRRFILMRKLRPIIANPGYAVVPIAYLELKKVVSDVIRSVHSAIRNELSSDECSSLCLPLL